MYFQALSPKILTQWFSLGDLHVAVVCAHRGDSVQVRPRAHLERLPGGRRWEHRALQLHHYNSRKHQNCWKERWKIKLCWAPLQETVISEAGEGLPGKSYQAWLPWPQFLSVLGSSTRSSRSQDIFYFPVIKKKKDFTSSYSFSFDWLNYGSCQFLILMPFSEPGTTTGTP